MGSVRRFKELPDISHKAFEGLLFKRRQIDLRLLLAVEMLLQNEVPLDQLEVHAALERARNIDLFDVRLLRADVVGSVDDVHRGALRPGVDMLSVTRLTWHDRETLLLFVELVELGDLQVRPPANETLAGSQQEAEGNHYGNPDNHRNLNVL